MFKRVKLGADIAAGKAPFGRLERWPGWLQLPSAGLDDQVDGVIRLLLGGVAQTETRAALLATAKDGEGSQLRGLVAVALGSPEFQRR
jgi:hypothetical protein